MRTAIVILNWNGKEQLKRYLPEVIRHSGKSRCTVYVADNGSTDGSVDCLREDFHSCKVIELDRNYGFAGGYNLALEKIDADLFCLLNSDVRVTEGWLDPVLELFALDSTIAAIQPKIRSDRDSSKYEHAGASGGYIDKYGYPFCRGRIMDVIEQDNGQYEQQSDIFWASGACLFIRAGVFRKAGGFDADFFAHMEEIDLCWRLKNQGYRIAYCPKSVIYNWGGATLEYNNPRKLFLNFRNSLWTLYKNYTGKHLRTMMFKRMIIDGFAVVKFAFTFDFKNMLAVVRAHSAYYQSLPSLRQKRAELQRTVIKRRHPEMLNKSIVWHFFVYRHKTFSSLGNFYDKG